MGFKELLASVALSLALVSCGSPAASPKVDAGEDWQSTLKDMLPLLGHRNWIVIADMAYPLQSGEGIVTLYADQPYLEVLRTTTDMIKEAPHVFAHVYNDKELDFLSEDMVKGIGELRSGIKEICGEDASSVMHEELISRLDEAGKLFTVVIIKTPLTVPYTTTFLELDCDYWTPSSQQVLDSLMR